VRKNIYIYIYIYIYIFVHFFFQFIFIFLILLYCSFSSFTSQIIQISLSLSPATVSCCPSQVPALQESQIKRNAILFHDLESQDGFLDIIGDDIAVEDGSEGGEGEQVLSFHEFDCHTLVNEQGGFPTIVNDEICSMKIYDMQSSRFSLIPWRSTTLRGLGFLS
jgi:hypothetical protein